MAALIIWAAVSTVPSETSTIRRAPCTGGGAAPREPAARFGALFAFSAGGIPWQTYFVPRVFAIQNGKDPGDHEFGHRFAGFVGGGTEVRSERDPGPTLEAS